MSLLSITVQFIFWTLLVHSGLCVYARLCCEPRSVPAGWRNLGPDRSTRELWRHPAPHRTSLSSLDYTRKLSSESSVSITQRVAFGFSSSLTIFSLPLFHCFLVPPSNSFPLPAFVRFLPHFSLPPYHFLLPPSPPRTATLTPSIPEALVLL